MLKRIFTLCLCLVLLISAVPVSVFADGADGGDIGIDDLPFVPADPTEPTVTMPTEPPVTMPTEPTETMPTEPSDPTEPTEPEEELPPSCGDELMWCFDAEMGYLSIFGQGDMYDFVGQTPWYAHRESIRTVEIAEGVTSIGANAFRDCVNLADIYIPQSVVGIDHSAFYDVYYVTCHVYRDSLGDIVAQELGFPVVYRGEDQPQDPTEPGGSIAGGQAGSLTWNITADGLLEITGEGWMDFYSNFHPAPWTAYASQVTGIYIADTVEFISSYAFVDMDLVTEATIPEGITYIQPQMFYDCDSLETVYFPSTALGMYNVFYSCDNLKNVYVAEGNPQLYDENGVGLRVWEGETTLCKYPNGRQDNTYTVSQGVQYIGAGAFQDAWALQYVLLPQSLLVMEDYAFENSGLKNITIPENVTFISYGAFQDCGDLKSLTFQGDLVEIAWDAFDGVNATAYYPKDNATWTKDALQNYGGNIKWVAKEAAPLEELIASGFTGDLTWKITKDGVLVFEGEGWTDFYMEGNPAPWKAYADQIQDVVLPATLKGVSFRLFEGLNNLTQVTIPEGVEVLGYEAFYNCENLKTVYLPSTIQHIDAPFISCGSLENIYVAEGNPVLYDDEGIAMLTQDGKRNLLSYPNGRTELVYTVAEGVQRISGFAFYEAKMKEVVLPDSLLEIGEHAFEGSRLQTITVPENVTYISYFAFADCTSLQSIEFLGDPMGVGAAAFDGVTADAYYPADNAAWTEEVKSWFGTGLNWIPLEKPAEEIIASGQAGSLTWSITESGLLEIAGNGWMDFYSKYSPAPWTAYADKVTGVKIADTVSFISSYAFVDMDRITQVTLPEGISYIQPEMFYDCDKLETVYFPSTALGMYNVFYSCDSLKNVYVAEGNPQLYDDNGVGMRVWEDTLSLCRYPNGRTESAYTVSQGVHYIGAGAFRDAKTLKQVVLPQSLRVIEDSAFAESGLVSITIPENVTFISYYAFQDCTDLKELTFRGDLVEIAEDAFDGVKAKAYYPKGNKTWNKSALKNYGGKITWIAQEAPACLHTTVTHVEGKAPTCNEAGSLEYWTCADCGGIWLDGALTQKAETTVLPAAHSLVHVPYKKPVQDQAGNKEHWYCEACDRLWLDELLSREAQWDDVVIPAGTEVVIRPLTLIPLVDGLAEVVEESDGSYTVYLDKEVVETEALMFSVRAKACDEEGQEISLGAKDLKWAASDSRLATVKADAVGTMATVTIKAKAEGAFVITAVNSKTKEEAAVAIHVRSYEPRLGTTAFTLNSSSYEVAITDLVPSYGNGINRVTLHDALAKGYDQEPSERFIATYEETLHQLVVTMPGSVKKGTYKLLLKAECENGEIYEYKVTMKVTQVMPTVTIKQLTKFNTFYSDSIAQFQITAKGGTIAGVGLEDNPALDGQYDSGTGILTVRYSTEFLNGDVKLKNKLNLRVHFEEYRQSLEKSVTLKTEKKAPKLALSENTGLINTALTDAYVAAFIVYDPVAEAVIPGQYIRPEASFAEFQIQEDDVVLVMLKGKQGGNVNVFVQMDNWTEPVKLTFKVALKNNLPTLVLSQKAFTLNTHFTDTVVCQEFWPDQHNVLLEGYDLMVYGKNESVLAEGQKLQFEFQDGAICMKLNPYDLPAPGTYEYRVIGYVRDYSSYEEEYLALAPKSFKVTVESKLPTVKLKSANLKLNKNLGTASYAETPVILPKGYEDYAVVDMVPAKANSDFGVSYNFETGSLRVTLNNSNARNAVLELHPVLQYLPTGQEVQLDTVVSAKLNVYGAKPTVAVTAKGKLDAIDPGSAMVFTIKKLTNIEGKPEDVYLRGDGAELFDVMLLPDSTAVLTIRHNAPVQKNKTYKPELVYLIDGQEAAAKVSVKVTQSNLKIAVPKSLNLFQSNSRLGCILTVTAPEGASIGTVSLSSKTAKQFLNAVGSDEALKFVELPDGTVIVTIKVRNPGYLNWGKSYNVYLDVIPDGNAENVKPTSVKLTVKTFK